MKKDILIYILFIVYVGGLFLTNPYTDDIENKCKEQQVIDLPLSDSLKNQVELTFAFPNDGKEEKEEKE